jgi:Domain of Unknown Function (DUF928)
MFDYRRGGLSIAIVLSFTTFMPMAIADSIPQRWAAKKYKVPNVGKPLRREAAATRGSCTIDSPVALVPIDGLTATTNPYPTLFFSVPTLPANSSLPVKFTLLDGNKTVYQTKFPLTGTRRTIGVILPATTELPPLEIDRDYRWSFSLQCGQTSASASHTIGGMIRRVAPDATLRDKLLALAPASPEPSVLLQLAQIYAEAELWQDALMQVVELRRLDPKNPQVIDQWKDLLHSVDLEAIAKDPIDP